MTDVEDREPKRIKRAENRLQAALDRLDTALHKRGDHGDHGGAVAAEVQGLQVENDRLRALLTTASERLDGTIAKFKTRLAG